MDDMRRPASCASSTFTAATTAFGGGCAPPRTAELVALAAAKSANLADRLACVGVGVFCVSWISLYTFNPALVRVMQPGDIHPVPAAAPDPVKCYLYSVIFAVVVFGATWIISRQMQQVAAAKSAAARAGACAGAAA
jgi:hypothetical protein